MRNRSLASEALSKLAKTAEEKRNFEALSALVVEAKLKIEAIRSKYEVRRGSEVVVFKGRNVPIGSVLVDHPEKRNASFRPVPAGSRSPIMIACRTYRQAISIFEEIFAGQDDFGSEYPTRIRVESENLDTGKRRIVRLEHERFGRDQAWHRTCDAWRL